MKVYIVWKTKYDATEESYILGIYKKLSVALKKCNNFNKTFITKKENIITGNDGLLGNFSTRVKLCKHVLHNLIEYY